jgi:hypothetical protein
MKAQDFFLMAIPFLLASLALLFQSEVIKHQSFPYGEEISTINTALVVTLFLAIGFFVAGIIKKLLANLSSGASLLSSNKPAKHV